MKQPSVFEMLKLEVPNGTEKVFSKELQFRGAIKDDRLSLNLNKHDYNLQYARSLTVFDRKHKAAAAIVEAEAKEKAKAEAKAEKAEHFKTRPRRGQKPKAEEKAKAPKGHDSYKDASEEPKFIWVDGVKTRV